MELLITVALLAILSTIAIGQFTEYRVRSYNVAAESDLANLVILETALVSEHGEFGGAATALEGLNLLDGSSNQLASVKLSHDVYGGVKVLQSGNLNISFVAATKNSRGNYAFGAELETPVMFKKPIAITIVLQDSDIPDPTSHIDFASPWVLKGN
jgi:Tfp pilus assembly protein PilE